MGNEISGLDINGQGLKKSLDNYSKYLDSIVNGRYSLEQREVELLSLSGGANANSRISQIATKLRSFDLTNDQVTSFDFNADDKSGDVDSSEDINLLNKILGKAFNSKKVPKLESYERGVGEEPQWVKDLKASNDYAFKTKGGYFVTSNKTGVNVSIYDTEGKRMTAIHGDPHVNEYDAAGRLKEIWHYADDSTFILPDGTKLWMNSVGNNNVKVNRGLYISDDQDLYHFGMEYGEGRETVDRADDKNNTQVHELRKLDIDVKQWDIENSDAHQSNNRNGVYAIKEETRQWAKLNTETMRFEDLNAESWGDYRSRTDDELFTNDEILLNRNQLIASLDGEYLRKFDSLEGVINENHLFEIQDLFLEKRKAFTDESMNLISSMSKFETAGLTDFESILDGNLNDLQKEFLTLSQANNMDYFADPNENKAMRQYLFESLFRERVSEDAITDISLDAKARADLILKAFSLEMDADEPFSDYLSNAKQDSLAIDLEKNDFLKKLMILDKVDFSGLSTEDQEAKSNFLDHIISKFLDKNEAKEQETFSKLSDNEKSFMSLLDHFLNLNTEQQHSFDKVFEYMSETFLNSKTANVYLFDSEEGEDGLIGSSGAKSSVNNNKSSAVSGGTQVDLIKALMGDTSVSFDEFTNNSDLIRSLKDESKGDNKEANKAILTELYTLRLNSLEKKLDKLGNSGDDSGTGGKSRVNKTNSENSNRKTRVLKTEIKKYKDEINKLNQ